MKKIIIATFVLVMVLCGCSNSNDEEKKDTSIVWNDENFENIIRYYLNNQNKNIYLKDLDNITELRIQYDTIQTNIKECKLPRNYNEQHDRITSIKDIENFRNLKILEISNQRINNIEKCKNSANISELNLFSNDINSLNNIEYFDNLLKLDLSCNYLDNIEHLKSLKNLKYLSLSCIGKKTDGVKACEYSVMDFATIKELHSLESLGMGALNIKDINLLSSCKNLKKLTLNDCNVTDDFINEITDLRNIEELSIFGVANSSNSFGIVDLSNLSHLKNLKKLCIGKNHVNIGKLSSLEELTTFYKEFLNEDLSGLVNLRTLDVSFSEDLESIDFIKEVTNLEKIRLYGTSIKNINNITSLKKIKELEIKSGNICKINLNNQLLKLDRLTISRNCLEDIDFISMCPNITYLDLSGNKISNIDSSLKLKKLNEVNFSDNNITDANILDNMKNLKIIDISDNPIKN
ncbi:leucine-rich repeat domain-containing protein [Sedimentibacter sp. zth1]|uniref:leucine-rich repeat domain-containing protein n=1 Tax=Sedimentibacter sp. zth1 TaxID=2816908 RepID=UPI001A91F452|nr:leucine-rich repeat domain-containing protein [Sedimentibacter sp. zth1]QSX05939.1 leucine-rich repeat domain-containing protein [Sedimentibacter sp. zth1]